MIKKRITKWDNIKFFLIMLVVIGHIADYYTKESAFMRSVYIFIYIFHMPAFIFISGMLSKKNINLKNYNCIFLYIVLYIVIKVIIFITELVLGGNPKFHLLSESYLPWYMLALAMFYLITMLIKDFDKKYIMKFFILLSCFAGYDSSIGDFLVLSRIIVFYPFFLLGYYLDPLKVKEFIDSKIIKVISLMIIVFTFVVVFKEIDELYWVRPLLTGRNPYSKLEYSELGSLCRLLYYLISTIVMFSVISLIPSREYVFSKWGQRTIQVYSLHHIFIYTFYKFYDGKIILLDMVGRFSEILSILLGVVLTIILCWDKLSIPFIKIESYYKKL